MATSSTTEPHYNL